MAKVQTWIIKVGEKNYRIEYTPKYWPNKSILTVNGEEIKLRQTFIQAFTGIDQPIWLGTKEVRFYVFNKKADIAVDDVFVDSKEPYIPLLKIQPWVWAFILLCYSMTIVGWTSNPLSIFIALIASLYIIRISVTPTMNFTKKITLVTLISAAAWLVFLGSYAIL